MNVPTPAVVNEFATAEPAIAYAPQEVSVGRIVHYVLPNDGTSEFPGAHRPAVVTQVWRTINDPAYPGMSNLVVYKGQPGDFKVQGISMNVAAVMVGSVSYDASGKPGTWHWPERV
jgi:hypothetical protein